MTDPEYLELLRTWDGAGDDAARFEFCAGLLQRFQHADAAHRSALRVAVRTNRHLWNTVADDALSAYLRHLREATTPVENLRARLTVCALTGGLGDWRDTIQWLVDGWQSAAKHGVEPLPHFEEIAALADDTNKHGVSAMSTRGLFMNAIVLACPVQGDAPNETNSVRASRTGLRLAAIGLLIVVVVIVWWWASGFRFND